MNLPEAPGRARRLAYDNYIRNNTRNDRINDRINDRDVIRQRGTSQIRQDIIITGRSLQTVEVINIENNNRVERLLISDLFKNSSIYFTKDLFSCSICLNETKDNIIRKLICSHNFHINCIETWLSNNTSCPICRYKLI
jgi:hypothetical protein